MDTVIFITPNFLQEVSLTAKWRLRHRFTTWKRTDPWTTLMPILNSHVQAHPMCKPDKVDARQTSELLISKYLEAASNIQHKLFRTGQAFFVMDKASLTARDCKTHTDCSPRVCNVRSSHFTLLSAADHKDRARTVPPRKVHERKTLLLPQF